MKSFKRVLTIAGSDSGGGAGIQADLKTISACGCYGMSAITAITAQNTLGVSAIHPVPIEIIKAQIIAVLDDIGADAIKIGMLHSVHVIECVTELLANYCIPAVVLDPVMVATSGDRLIQEDAIKAMCDLLIPHVTLITPNIPEMEILLGESIPSDANLAVLAERLGEKFKVSVLAKAGHLDTDILTDTLYNYSSKKITGFTNTKIITKNSHGTGCTLSSAIASFLTKSQDLETGVKNSVSYVAGAIREGADYKTGKGHGPVHHFHNLWSDTTPH